MHVTTNRFGPAWPKHARAGDLDLLIQNAAPEMEFFFWTVDEQDFFNSYYMMRGKDFKTCLWTDRWKTTDKRVPLGSTFIRIPAAQLTRRLP